jgi:serine/threonine-protein kinase RsbW
MKKKSESMVAFQVSYYNTSLHMSFPATLENVDKAAQEAKRFLSQIGAEEHAFQVVLVLREALLNAVLSGSKLEAEKRVVCAIRQADNDLLLEVEDEGEGFDWRRQLGKAPAAGHESGRGLAIMKAYCQDVMFNQKGNKLTLKKRIRFLDPH